MVSSHKILRSFTLFLLIFLSLKGWASNNYKFDYYSVKHGLAHTHVLSIFQDSKGFLWFGTYGGLHLFNGYTFQIYTSNPGDTNSISNHSVNVIFEDDDGFLWFGTEWGLNKYDRKSGKFTQFLHDANQINSIAHNTIKTINQDSAGIMWIGTYGGGLLRFDPYNNTFRQFNSERLGIVNNAFDKINAVVDNGNHTFWVGTEEGGLFLFDAHKAQVSKKYFSLTNNQQKNTLVNSLLKDKEGTLWVGTWDEGFFKYHKSTDSFIYVTCHSANETNPDKDNIRDIVEDNLGNLWLAHFGAGLTKYNIHNNSYQNFYYNKNEKHSLSHNYVWSLFIDKTDNLWAGTFGGGLNKLILNQYQIPLLQIPSSYSSPTDNDGISTLIEDVNGVVWLGTLGAGVFQYNYQTNTYKPFKISENKRANAVIDIFEDRDSQLWFGTDYGLYKVDALRQKIYSYKHNPNVKSSINDAPIYHISQDSKGNIWLGTWNGGVQMLSYSESKKEDTDSAKFVKYIYSDTDSNSISNNIVYSIFEDSSGDIWIGTSLFLEKLSNKTGKISKLHKFVVGSMYEDEDGLLWVGTLSDGLYTLNKEGTIVNNYKSLEDLPSKTYNELPVSSILGMIADSNGQIWLTTNKGLSKYNKETSVFSNYALADDLHQNALSLNAITRFASGAIAVGGIDGFNIIWPNKLMSNLPTKPVVFTDFKIYNKSIVKDISNNSNARISTPASEVTELHLSYKDKMLQIEFAALEYTSPHRINYAYKLVGFDKNWVNDIYGLRHAAYSNLKPGEYTFLVKATNSRGKWGEQAAKLKIFIKPPYWQTNWFIAIIMALGLIIVLLITQIRTQSLYKQKKELELQVEAKTSEILKQNQVLAKANLALKKQKEEVIEKTEEAKQANELKLRFFTSMSHEFKTPLTLILGPIEHLKEMFKTSQESNYYLSVIQKNAFRLLRLINEILDLRKIDTKNLQVYCIKADLVLFIQNILNAFNASAKKKAVLIEFQCSVKEYITWFDPGKMEIVFYNLISNALHFTPSEGKITIHLKVNENKKELYISVADTGIGISADSIHKIFDRFYQAQLSSSAGYKGTGIGLSLTKEIIESLNGNITVNSIPNRGTQFEIVLPILNKEENSTDSPFVFNNSAESEPDFQIIDQLLNESEDYPAPINQSIQDKDVKDRSKILLVEDDEDLRIYVKSCLINDYIIHEASNGEEALELAKNLQPSLIISDIMMPIMDGIELCKRIKEDFLTSHIPVILLSAKTSIELQMEGFETGADAFIPKPFNKKYLITRVKAIIDSRRKLQELFYSKVNMEPKEITVTSVDELFIEKVKKAIENNMDNSEFGVSELVKEMGMSRTLLHMKLKKITNCTSSEFIKIMRLKRACQLLEKRTHRISEIGYMVGFNDPHSFSKIFKKQFGLTPTQYANKGLS
ncbi:Signal transduction histidine kinase [Saccharicrinis carchari]|uniref:histidine kinase n=1 Tax=Saccharicrinis carchari TaxID=1168039 RepID=A0A521DEW2_SACCC|nr:two-component regulator propeller domain-containing protein [Saccharicrinis carchari]SMO69500.1 Signal transduction histidine kinase [Saccharicrinis carchari]